MSWEGGHRREDATFTHPGFRYIGPLGQIGLPIETIGLKKVKETNIRYEPDEFNLFRARRGADVKGAIVAREEHTARPSSGGDARR